MLYLKKGEEKKETIQLELVNNFQGGKPPHWTEVNENLPLR